jgi:hypothetical protein
MRAAIIAVCFAFGCAGSLEFARAQSLAAGPDLAALEKQKKKAAADKAPYDAETAKYKAEEAAAKARFGFIAI